MSIDDQQTDPDLTFPTRHLDLAAQPLGLDNIEALFRAAVLVAPDEPDRQVLIVTLAIKAGRSPQSLVKAVTS